MSVSALFSLALASWGVAVLFLGGRLARLKRRSAALSLHKRPRDSDVGGDEVGDGPPAPGNGWSVAAGERWEGSFWWRESDELAGADAGQARVFVARGERHAGQLCVKVAPRGGQLFNDRVVWSALQASGAFASGGLPRLHAHLHNVGPDGSEEALVSELCGRSLAWHLARAPGGRLEPADVLLVGAELLRLIGCCHAAGYAHRDVTPANVLMPVGGSSRAPDGALLYLIDFGISERLRTERAARAAAESAPSSTARGSKAGRAGAAAPRAQDRSGTLRFATPHLGTAPLARRDDVLGTCFVLLACAAGELPWDAIIQAGAGGKAAAQARALRVRVADAKLRFLDEAAGGQARPRGAGGGNDDESWWEGIADALLRAALRSCVAAAARLGVDDVPDLERMRAELLAARARAIGARRTAAEAQRGEPELSCLRDVSSAASALAGTAREHGAGAPRPVRPQPQERARPPDADAGHGQKVMQPAAPNKRALRHRRALT